jgi:hypothetical protein
MTGMVGIGKFLRGLGASALGWMRRGSWALCVAACLLGPAAARADFTENFDGVTPPNLPASWTAANATGSAPLWVTTTTSSDSAPNNVFVGDMGDVNSDKRLDSPPISIASTTAVLTFRNNYVLVGLAGGGDAGVLEISINGGAFQDILAAGGSFVGGGYNLTLAGGTNPLLVGRMVWAGDSGGYITTTVNLPAAAAGTNIVLRFRMAADDNAPSPGWHIDSIAIREDTDGDGVADAVDNCPGVSNANQSDADGDGRGDVCDNCPSVSNANQADTDGDGRGDVCDNCPVAFNADQVDADGDGKGNACDNCPNNANADQADSDGNGTGDACEATAPSTNSACGTCAQGVLPAAFLSLSLMMLARRRLSRGRSIR